MDYQTKNELYEKKKSELLRDVYDGKITWKEYEQRLKTYCDKIKF